LRFIQIKNKMRYLITTNNNVPFLTKWFDPENHFNKQDEMVVYDLVNYIYMDDGITWKLIDIDHL